MGIWEEVKKKKKEESEAGGGFNATERFQAQLDFNNADELVLTNQQAAEKAKKYDEIISSGGYISQEDLADYRNAYDVYIDTGNRLRNAFKYQGYQFTDADEADWATQVAGLNEHYQLVYDTYSPYADETAFLRGSQWNWQWRQQQYEDNKKRIEELKAQRDNLIPQVTFNPDSNVPLPFYDQGYLSRRRELESQIAELEKQNAQYERGEGDWASKEVDDSYSYYTSEAFPGADTKRDYKNPSLGVLSQTTDHGDRNQWYYDENGVYRDAYGNALETDEFGNWIDPRNADHVIEDKLGLFLNASEEERNRAAAGDWGINNVSAAFREGIEGDWTYLQDWEIDVYYAYLEESKEKAYQYLANMERELDRRRSMDEQGKWYEEYEKSTGLGKVGMNLMTVPANLLGGFGGVVSDASAFLRGEDINPYSTAHSLSNYTRTVRGATAEELSDVGLLGDFYTMGDLYGAGMSILDTLAASTLPFGSVLLASSAAEGEAVRLYQEGASNEQIAFGAAAAGAAELIFESLSLGNLEKIKEMPSPETLGQFFKTILVQGGVEASEEVLTEIANTVSNAFIMGAGSDWQKLVDEKGAGALFDKTMDALHAGISGFLSGGGTSTFVAGASVINHKAQVHKQNVSVGKTVMAKTGGVDALLDLAKKLNINTAKVKAGNASQVGQLYYAVSEAVSKRTRAALISKMQEKGVSEEAAEKVSGVATTFATGGRLTKPEEDLLTASIQDEKIFGAMTDVLLDKESPVRQNIMQLGSLEVSQDVQVEDGALGDVEQEIAPEEAQGDFQGYIASLGIDLTEASPALSKKISQASKDFENATYREILSQKMNGVGEAIQRVAQEKGGSYALDMALGAALDVASEAYTEAIISAPTEKKGLFSKKKKAAPEKTESKPVRKAEPKKSEQATEKKEDMDGKTFLESSGEEVKSISVKRIGKGGAVVTVNGGTEASLSDVSFGDERTHLAYSRVTSVEGMTAEAANKILSNPKAERFDFINEAIRAFQGGLRNESVAENLNYDIISADEARALFEEGRKAVAAQAQAAQKLLDEIYQKAKAEVEKTGKKVNAELRYADGLEDVVLEGDQAACAELAARMAPALRGDIVLYDGPEGGKMGYYKYGEDAIYLNVNAKFDEKSMMAFVLAHEMVHRGRHGSPLKYQAFADLLIQEFTKKGVSLDVLIQEQLTAAKEAKVKMTRTQAFEEVICDACQRMLTDTKAGRILAEWGAQNDENRGFLENLKEFLTKLFNTLRKAFAGERSENRAVAAFRALDKSVQDMLAEMYVDMTKDAAEKLSVIKAAGMLDKTNTTGDGGVRYSVAGVASQTANMQSLAEAKRQLGNGVSPEQIRKETGWFQGYDGMWRYEISDKDMEIDTHGRFHTNPDIRRYNELVSKVYFGDGTATDEDLQELQTLKKNLQGVNMEPSTLGQLIKHDALFFAYPRLKNIAIKFADITERARYSPASKTITIRNDLKADPSQLGKTLVHEIQHAIQDLEGFTGGASVEYWRNMGIPENKLVEYYEKTAGEIEARDVSARKDLSSDDIKENRPDIDRTDVVFSDSSAVSKDFAGWTIDGNEVYTTSKTVQSLSISDRIAKFKTDFAKDFEGRTAKLIRNGHVYYAHFSKDSSTFGKLTYEGKAESSRSSQSGYKAKIRMLADGTIFELVEDATYKKTAPESGGKNTSHRDAKYWDYFIKTVIVDGKAYDVLISVRLDETAGNWTAKERYVYSIRFRDNKTAATSVASPASSKVLHQGDVAAVTDMISEDHPVVKQNSSTDSDGRQLSEGQREYFADSAVRDENGNLLVMYHGTSRGGFTIFDVYGSNYGLFGGGSYFTSSRSVAQNYTKKGRGDNPQVYAVYLNIKNPLDMDAQADPAEWAKAFPDVTFPESGTNEQFFRAVEEFFMDEGYKTWEAQRSITESIQDSMGYDGITHIGGGRVDADGERHRVYIAFEQNQIKRTDNLNPTENVDIDRKLPVGEASRMALVDALEPLAKDDKERKALTSYRARIEAIAADEKRLAKTRAEISRLWKSGDRKSDRLTNLRKAEETIRKRLVRADSALLDMEGTGVLKELMERKVASRLLSQRKKLSAEYQKSRERATERRKASDVRGKIKRLKAKMQSTLLNPSEKNFVPVSLFEAIVSVLELVDDNTELYKPDGTINQAQAARDATYRRLNKLKDLYGKLDKTNGGQYKGEFDEYVAAYLDELFKEYEGRSLAEMSLDELGKMYEILKSIQDVIMDARKLIGMNERYDVYEATDAIAAEQQAITDGRKNGKRNFVGIANDTMNNQALSPMRNIERMAGYDEDSMLVKLFREIEKGVRKANLFMMRAYKMFEELTASPEYDDALYKEVTVDGKTVEYTDYKGRKFGLSKMQMMQAILSYEREQAVDNLNHIATGGFTFADLRMLRKGKLKEAISEENSHRVPAATEMVLEFIEILKDDKWCQDYMAVAREFFNHMAKDAINEASIATKHRAVATGEAYVPFETDQNFVVKEIGAAADEVQQTISSYGMLKDTQNNAPQPLIVTGLNNLIERHISQVGNVYGLAVPIRNFNKVWTAKTQPGVDGAPTVRGLIEGNWGTKGAAHIEQAVQDVQGPRKRDQGVFADLYRKLKSNYIGATFLFNLSVVMKQLGSLFTATSMIQWRNPVSMMANLIYTATHFQQIAAEVDQYTASVWMRRQGLSDAELSTLMTEGQKTWLGKLAKKGPAWANPTKWIAGMDSAVALSLWRYCKEDVAARTGLEGEALLEATAEFFDDVVENTQSMTDVLHRPEIQKNTNIFSEPFAMFKTDVYQMAGQLNVAAGRAFANPTKENKRALSKTVYSIAMSAVWGQLMTAAFAALRYKMDRYKDDEDELTWKSFLKRSLFSLGGDLAGYVFPIFGSEIVGIGEALAYGETDDFLDNMTMSNVNELYSMIISIFNAMMRGKEVSPQKWNKLIAKALQLFGVPTNNIIRLWEAIRKHATDIAEGEFFAFNEE